MREISTDQLIQVVDNFCPEIDAVRASALESGFGKWLPNKGEVGSSIYEGMNFWGRHSFMYRAITRATGRHPYPNNTFFRVTNVGTEKAYVHSDRMWGKKTCICYLSGHAQDYGTGFFRHRATGLLEMPSFEEMKEQGIFDQLSRDMVNGSENDWERVNYVPGAYNRAVIFHAPLFHARLPKDGIGDTDADGRMVWACHFNEGEF